MNNEDKKVLEAVKLFGEYCIKQDGNCEETCIFGKHIEVLSGCPIREYMYYPVDLIHLAKITLDKASAE